MTLIELKTIIEQTIGHNKRAADIEVVVEADRPSMGPVATDRVVAAQKGIDWNRNHFIIRIEKQEPKKRES
jgi:glycerate kinase